jgi:hypothetical protein
MIRRTRMKNKLRNKRTKRIKKIKTRKHKKITKHNTKKHRKRGGLKNSYVCESEGCVIHPSIISNSSDTITKLYHNEKIYNKEKSSYALFDSVDPTHKYHCQIFSSGLLEPAVLHSKLKQEIRGLNLNKSYYYIDMEYAGNTLGSITHKDNIPKIKEAFIRFLIDVLNLRTNDGKYLVHGDPHPGNICYKMDDKGNYIIKYIDITNMDAVSPDTIIKSGSDITRQFASLLGGTRILFGFSNKITDTLLPIVMSAPERKYEDVLNEIINVLINIGDVNSEDEISKSPMTSPRESMDSNNESPIAIEKMELGKGIKRMQPLFDSPPNIERKNSKLSMSDSIEPKKIRSSLFDDYRSPPMIPRRFDYGDTDEDKDDTDDEV